MIHGHGSTSGREERLLVERGRNDVTVSAADPARPRGHHDEEINQLEICINEPVIIKIEEF